MPMSNPPGEIQHAAGRRDGKGRVARPPLTILNAAEPTGLARRPARRASRPARSRRSPFDAPLRPSNARRMSKRRAALIVAVAVLLADVLAQSWINGHTVNLVVVNASGKPVEISWQPAASASTASELDGGCASHSLPLSRGQSWRVSQDGNVVLDSSSASLPLLSSLVAGRGLARRGRVGQDRPSARCRASRRCPLSELPEPVAIAERGDPLPGLAPASPAAVVTWSRSTGPSRACRRLPARSPRAGLHPSRLR